MILNDTINAQMSGHYRLEIRKAISGDLVRELEFDNLILNSGLNRLCEPWLAYNTVSNRAICNTCVIGTGTASPSAEQTSLGSLSSSTTTIQGSYLTGIQSSVLPYYGWARRTWRFAAGQLNGNYTEVGTGWGTSSGQLFSRALILDGSNNPIAITVLSDEFLDVTYETRLYVPQDQDVVQNATITGVGAVTFTRRPAILNDSSTTLHGITSYSAGNYGWQPALGFMQVTGVVAHIAATTRTTMAPLTTTSFTLLGSASSISTGSFSTYVADTFVKDTTITIPLNNHNGTWQHFIVGTQYAGAWQYLINPTFTKTSAQTLTLTVRASLSRYTP